MRCVFVGEELGCVGVGEDVFDKVVDGVEMGMVVEDVVGVGLWVGVDDEEGDVNVVVERIVRFVWVEGDVINSGVRWRGCVF